MVTSPSHLITRKAASRTWMQIGVHNKKQCFQEVHDNEKHDQGIT